MHSFLRAVGFGSIKSRSDEEKLVSLVIDNATEKHVVSISEDRSIVELVMEVSEDTGVIVRGETDAKGILHVAHYFPFHRSNSLTAEEPLFVNKRVDTDAYTGMCDDYRLGVSLIFYIQNVVDILKNPMKKKERRQSPIYLSAQP